MTSCSTSTGVVLGALATQAAESARPSLTPVALLSSLGSVAAAFHGGGAVQGGHHGVEEFAG